mmetsp:Transcript_19279/g.29209  ORF Transcript_19279/g.29209 Transcript_19279/m.29209 type:complete len:275 (-) Transcript_19279:220-1044(-)|eukprot:CAMPEP_0194097868 /NCGR_PEP_ID=MMETSP0149-20130528/58084_1 /TAXON_ID=122233 /ORGANISM="Chaetoceros debilis, Strain MM31A-1" /LENGTH=274 /DNA_ID=CAMNT_0038783897 /DNA_START=138 /DNA_END=962 /DNA_ORIENTATION=-
MFFSSICYFLRLTLVIGLTTAWSPSPITNKKYLTRSNIITLRAASVETLDGTLGLPTTIINEAADFMVKEFWGVDTSNSGLLAEIQHDLDSRFGEILGKRKLFSSLILSRSEDSNVIIGLIGVEVGLLDLTNNSIINFKESDKIITNAVASLGPKQRRQFKDASIEELLTELPDLNGRFEAVAVLANLCVSKDARGMGIGKTLCDEVEVVSGKWNLQNVLLKVEEGNKAARKLYEKLGFAEKSKDEEATTLRPNFEKGCFDEVGCTILTLYKSL